MDSTALSGKRVRTTLFTYSLYASELPLNYRRTDANIAGWQPLIGFINSALLQAALIPGRTGWGRGLLLSFDNNSCCILLLRGWRDCQWRLVWKWQRARAGGAGAAGIISSIAAHFN